MKLKSNQKSSGILLILLYLWYLLFFISMIFSFRAYSSISIALILVTGMIKNKIDYGYLVQKNTGALFITGCILFYLLQFTALLHSSNMAEGWNHIRLKSALLFVPLAVAGINFLNAANIKKLMSLYSVTLLAACLYCLIAAFLRFRTSHDGLTFFYYDLVSPFAQHAVYFSILIFIALVFLMEHARKNFMILNKVFHLSLVIFFTLFLFLLSSRLVLSFYGIFLIYFFIFFFKKRILTIGVIISMAISGFLAMTTDNPVSRRFHDLVNDDLSILKQEQFNPGNYFNGIQFRLLQWRFVPEILSENKSWITGVSPADAQALLNKKYIEKNMYTGETWRGDEGFLGYNTHNQLLQSLLQSGIIGLFVFLLIFFSIVKMIWRKRDRILSFVTILLLLYSFLESLFETQYGLLLFIFFPLFFYGEKDKEIKVER